MIARDFSCIPDVRAALQRAEQEASDACAILREHGLAQQYQDAQNEV